MSDESDRQLSTRVNAARLAGYLNKNIRLPCRVLFADGGHLLVEASDGGQVTVTVPANLQDGQVPDPYIEVVGKVQDSSTVVMLSCVGMGAQLDMKLVNETIELIHDPRFLQKMFG